MLIIWNPLLHTSSDRDTWFFVFLRQTPSFPYTLHCRSGLLLGSRRSTAEVCFSCSSSRKSAYTTTASCMPLPLRTTNGNAPCEHLRLNSQSHMLYNRWCHKSSEGLRRRLPPELVNSRSAIPRLPAFCWPSLRDLSYIWCGCVPGPRSKRNFWALVARLATPQKWNMICFKAWKGRESQCATLFCHSQSCSSNHCFVSEMSSSQVLPAT